MTEEILSADAISQGLPTTFVGRNVLYLPRVSSTMDVARERARQGAVKGTVVITDEQTAGRGRLQRAWLAPAGNIALSIILHPDLSRLPYLVMQASLAVVHAIEVATGLCPRIKWPNDVLVNGKKVCGILIENDVRGQEVNYAIIGIGINVNLNAADYAEIQATATSLSHEAGCSISRLELTRRLLVEIEKLYLAEPRQVFREWRSRLVTLGRKVRVTSGDSVLEGIAESVDTDGTLLLRRPDGTLTRIVAGDVTLRETA